LICQDEAALVVCTPGNMLGDFIFPQENPVFKFPF
jgi:hypothetical protein